MAEAKLKYWDTKVTSFCVTTKADKAVVLLEAKSHLKAQRSGFVVTQNPITLAFGTLGWTCPAAKSHPKAQRSGFVATQNPITLAFGTLGWTCPAAKSTKDRKSLCQWIYPQG